VKPERKPLSTRKLAPQKASGPKVVLVELRCPNGKLHDLVFDEPDEIIDLRVKQYLDQGWTYPDTKSDIVSQKRN
jgi:hypothetical protein